MRAAYKYRFCKDISFQEVEETLLFSFYAASRIFGNDRVCRDGAYLPDRDARTLIVDVSTLIGQIVNAVFWAATVRHYGGDCFNSALGNLWKVLKMAAFTIGSALAPVLQETAEWITRLVVSTSAWIKENKGLIVSVFKIAVGVVAAGAAIVGLGYAISGLAAVVGALTTIAGVVHGVLSVVMTVIGAMLTPIGLVVTAVLGLGAYFLYASGAAGEAMDWLSEGFAELADDAKTSFGAIGKALASGDIALAARVLWAFLKMEGEKGCALLEKAWLNFRNFFIRIGYDAFYGLLAVGEYVWNDGHDAGLNGFGQGCPRRQHGGKVRIAQGGRLCPPGEFHGERPGRRFASIRFSDACEIIKTVFVLRIWNGPLANIA